MGIGFYGLVFGLSSVARERLRLFVFVVVEKAYRVAISYI